MKVVLSPLAQWKIEQLLEYLEIEWSLKSKEKFWKILLESFNQIANAPRSAPESEEFPNLFRKVVTKQTSYYYRIKSDKIEIIDLVDNRQDPDTIYKSMKKHFG